MMREPAYPVFERRPKTRRSAFDTRLDILRALRHEPKRVLRISMETNMCYQSLKSNVEFMARKGLVGLSDVPPKTKRSGKHGVLVFLTRKGLLVLDRLEAAYGELLDLRSHEEDLVRGSERVQEDPLEASPL